MHSLSLPIGKPTLTHPADFSFKVAFSRRTFLSAKAVYLLGYGFHFTIACAILFCLICFRKERNYVCLVHPQIPSTEETRNLKNICSKNKWQLKSCLNMVNLRMSLLHVYVRLVVRTPKRYHICSSLTFIKFTSPFPIDEMFFHTDSF